MLRALPGKYIARPLQSMPARMGNWNPDRIWITKMVIHMIRRGYKSTHIWRILRKRVSVSRQEVYNIYREYDRLEFTLADGPPFCHIKIYGSKEDLAPLVKPEIGEIIDLCPFCMLRCDREGVRCKAIKESGATFRFLQLGQD